MVKGDLKIMKPFPKELKNLVGIKETNFQTVVNDANFKRGAMILSGGYAGQNFYSIMASKLYDINQEGFCLWAHRYIKSIQGLEFTFRFFNCEGEKYLVMTYTPDKKYADGNSPSIINGESINEYYKEMWKTAKENSEVSYVKEYKCCNKDSYEKYPDKMFPEIIFKANYKNFETAYIISEFSYLTENISLKDFCSLYNQTTQQNQESTTCNYFKRPNHRLIELKGNYELFLSDEIEKSNEITYIIAKLKYPYIVELKR